MTFVGDVPIFGGKSDDCPGSLLMCRVYVRFLKVHGHESGNESFSTPMLVVEEEEGGLARAVEVLEVMEEAMG